MAAGAQAIFVASNGPYDFLGTKYFRASEGHRFDRLRIVQDGRTFSFVQDNYFYPGGFRGRQVAGVFALAANSGFDPVKPWRLEVLVNTVGANPLTIPFALDYKIPQALVLMPPEPEPPDPGVDRGLERCPRERRDARRAPLAADSDLCVPGRTGAQPRCAPAGA